MTRPTLDFWFEFASTYSYLSAMRIERLASEQGVTIRWRPFMLGPIFAAQGWTSSPFNIYPAKGRHMWRDMEREAATLGLPFRRPDPFPQNGLLAARVALVGAEEEWCPAFVRGLYEAEFAQGRPIAEPDVVGDVLIALGKDAVAVIARASTDDNKAALKAQTEEALRLGLFGAPNFVTPDGEMFWGNDRLDAALDWVSALNRVA